METGAIGREKRPPSALGLAGHPQLVPRHAEPSEGCAPTGRRPLLEEDGVFLGTYPDRTPAFLWDVDRRRHLYLIGKTGMGKSTLMHTLMLSDLHRARGFALLDPHGDLAERVADNVPSSRFDDVICLDPSDPNHHAGFNPLSRVRPDQRPLVAAQIVAAFAHIWNISLKDSPRLEYILTNALRLLLDTPGSTLLGLPRLLVDTDYREGLIAQSKDPMVRAYWLTEFAEYTERYTIEAIGPVQNKVGALLSPPAIRNMLGQPRSTIDVQRVMDESKILIVNLAKGRLGETPAHLIGALLVTAFAHAAEARAAVSEDDRRDFTLYADEFQHFAASSFVGILSEARKYRLSLVLAHQFLGQLPDLLRQAVIGNAGSMLVFRAGAEDARLLADELGIENRLAVTETSNYKAWLKLSSHGVPSEPRILDTALPEPYAFGMLERVRRRSRARHMRRRELVEKKIDAFLGLGQ